MKELQFDISLQPRDFYDYLLRHTFHSTKGLLVSCVGAMCLLLFLGNQQAIFLLAGVGILAGVPVSLWIQSKNQTKKDPMYQKPVTYIVNEAGISVVFHKDVSHMCLWKDMHYATSTAKNVIIYADKNRAYIFPRRELGPLTGDMIAVISTHMEPGKVNIRY